MPSDSNRTLNASNSCATRAVACWSLREIRAPPSASLDFLNMSGLIKRSFTFGVKTTKIMTIPTISGKSYPWSFGGRNIDQPPCGQVETCGPLWQINNPHPTDLSEDCPPCRAQTTLISQMTPLSQRQVSGMKDAPLLFGL